MQLKPSQVKFSSNCLASSTSSASTCSREPIWIAKGRGQHCRYSLCIRIITAPVVNSCHSITNRYPSINIDIKVLMS